MTAAAELAERVDAIECAHALEAEVRELRLIGAHHPRFNRRSRNPRRAWRPDFSKLLRGTGRKSWVLSTFPMLAHEVRSPQQAQMLRNRRTRNWKRARD